MPLDLRKFIEETKAKLPAADQAQQEQQEALLQEIQNGGKRNPYRDIEREAAARKANLDEYRRLQEARRNSETKQTELLKGIAEGKSTAALFITALECISAATGNNYYRTAAAAQFLEIYGGDGLQEPEAVQIQLQEVEARLDRLKQSAQRETSENIKRAIRAHEQKAADLRQIIG